MLLYRILLTLLALKEVSTRTWHRDWAGIKARFGRISPQRQAKHIWIHAASNGEAMSVKPVIDRLIVDGKAILLTVNTDSARDLANKWPNPRLDVQLAPIDLPGVTRRVHKNWDISAHIAIESELWPHRILSCPGPVLVLGGRLTPRSAKGWRRLETLARRTIAKVDYLSAQDPGSLERFVSFGLKPAAQGPVFDLKALYDPKDEPPDAKLTSAFSRVDTWLAASTHDGEDAIVLAAHKAALVNRPNLRLILAPRHPKRADAIAQLVADHGLTCARRSRNDDPASGQVYLADTLGEMHLWYALAGATFVAGSLTDRGGHTPYEPAYFGSALLHGPDTANFKAAYDRLTKANAATCVQDAESLTAALRDLADPQKQIDLGIAAQQALKQDTDFDALMRDINATLSA